MGLSKERGDAAEMFITKKIPCPNCNGALKPLPVGFPLYDVQCSKCVFRAQVKSARGKPKPQLFGGGMQILNAILRTGQLIPPLIAYFHEGDGRSRSYEVLFFPFLSYKKNIRPRTRSATGKRPGYEEFNYINLLDDDVPRKVLARHPKAELT